MFEDPRVLVVVAVVGLVVLRWFFVIPLAVLVLDILFVLLLTALGIAFRAVSPTCPRPASSSVPDR